MRANSRPADGERRNPATYDPPRHQTTDVLLHSSLPLSSRFTWARLGPSVRATRPAPELGQDRTITANAPCSGGLSSLFRSENYPCSTLEVVARRRRGHAKSAWRGHFARRRGSRRLSPPESRRSAALVLEGHAQRGGVSKDDPERGRAAIAPWCVSFGKLRGGFRDAPSALLEARGAAMRRSRTLKSSRYSPTRRSCASANWMAFPALAVLLASPTRASPSTSLVRFASRSRCAWVMASARSASPAEIAS